MKTAAMSPKAAFPNGNIEPTDEALGAAIGAKAFAGWQEVTQWLERTHAPVDPGWAFSPAVGWRSVPVVKKRRVCYFIPERDDLRLNVILGDKAIGAMKRGPAAAKFASLLESAVRYSEGTAFMFTRRTFDPGLVIQLLEAKFGS